MKTPVRSLLVLILLLAPAFPAGAAPDPGNALKPLSAGEWSQASAAHLLRRAGFGGSPADIESLHALGLDGALDRLLAFEGKPDPGMAYLNVTVLGRPPRGTFVGLSREERQEKVREWQRADRGQLFAVREWWMRTMIGTAHPLRERMTLFWHGHFTSGYRDVRNSYHMYVQNALFRRHATGSFRELLTAVSTDPAMLEYLDNNRNRAGRPNENFARELMELFTLGVGNYTEQDIKEAARALTGWTFRENAFVFDTRRHDPGHKTFLGQSGYFTGDDVLRIILEQPAAARYLARKTFIYFAHEQPSDEVVEALARVLREADYEFEPMLRALFRSQAFYSQRAMGTRVKGPVELIVGLHRTLELEPPSQPMMAVLAQQLGQGLMDPPNVKGWDGGRDWITTSHLLNRYNFAGAVVGEPRDRLKSVGRRFPGRMPQIEEGEGKDGEAGGMEGMDEMEPAERRQRGRKLRRARFEQAAKESYDPLAEVRRLRLGSAEEIVDHFTARLLAVPAPQELREALLQALNRERPFDLEARDARSRLHGMLRLLVSTPEFQLM